MTKQQVEKELFDTVYQWGRVGVIVDENTPTFKRILQKLYELKNVEEK